MLQNKRSNRRIKDYSDYEMAEYFEKIDHKMRISSLNAQEKSILDFLKRKRRYDDIYFYFGSKLYRRNTPIFVQAKDVVRLLNEERYYDFYEKYGEKIYTAFLPYMTVKDRHREKGSSIAEEAVDIVQHKLRAAAITAVAVFLILNSIEDITLIGILGSSNNDRYTNDSELIEILDEYDETIATYADYINSLNLSHLDVIVKVMSDMWDNIYGYNGAVEGYSNNLKYNRLAIYTYGYGVCRHMADDFTARMNAINPEYKAYNMTVYLSGTGEYNDIERYWFPEKSVTEEGNESLLMNHLKTKVGNHMVSCVSIPDTGIELIVDVTNPSIGILKNGQIVMLTEDKVPNMVPMHDSNIGYNLQDKEALFAYIGDCIKSYFCSPNFEALKEEYGTKAQNEALEELAGYDSSHYTIHTINTATDEENMGKTPLYYSGYTIECLGERICLHTESLEARAIEKAGYHEINNFLRDHSNLQEVEIRCSNDTVDFSKIDFSLLECAKNLNIVYTTTASSDKVLDIEGTVDEVTVKFETQGTSGIGRVAIQTKDTEVIAVYLADGLVADEIYFSPNENARVISLESTDKLNVSVENHVGQLKCTYSCEGSRITEETSYAKRIQKTLP